MGLKTTDSRSSTGASMLKRRTKALGDVDYLEDESPNFDLRPRYISCPRYLYRKLWKMTPLDKK